MLEIDTEWQNPEYGLLGLMLKCPNIIPEIIHKIRSVEGLFDSNQNQIIFEAFIKEFDATGEVDFVDVGISLKKDPAFQIPDINPLIYMTQLYPNPFPVVNWPYFLKPLIDRRKFRQTQLHGQRLLNSTEGDDPNELRENVIRANAELVDTYFTEPSKTESNLEVVHTVLAEAEKSLSDPDAIEGIESGFKYLDRMTKGFKPGQLIIIASRPGNGKTSIAVNILNHLALSKGIPIAFFSLEMSKREIMKRIIYSEAKYDPYRCSQSDIVRFSKVAQMVSTAPIFIEDETDLNPGLLHSKLAKLVESDGVKIAIVDYLQLMNASGESRVQQIGLISRGLKKSAKELGIPIIALCQLNRQADQPNKEPSLTDLRESGSIEQDADLVCMMKANPDKDTEEGKLINFNLKKNRSGPTGDFDLLFLPQFTRFETVERYQPPDD